MTHAKNTSFNGNDCVFCTLFDSNYLDKGIVLYESMARVMDSFRLYVFAFDDLTAEILNAMGCAHMIVVSLQQFETDELKSVKNDRSNAEYCWTCTPWIIEYVLNTCKEEICTYIDADMMFFGSPELVFRDMREKGCSVIITPHRFGTSKKVAKGRNTVGEYCVEFNTFVNDYNGRVALDWWAEKCLEWCYYTKPGTTEWYGDQKYLNVFPEAFDGVYICEHLGIGLAPWNASQVEAIGNDDKHPVVRSKTTGEEYPVILYHFANMYFLTDRLINACSQMPDKKLHQQIYDPYILAITRARQRLIEDYGFPVPRKKRVVTKSPLLRIYQKFIQPIRHLKRLSDVYKIKE